MTQHGAVHHIVHLSQMPVCDLYQLIRNRLTVDKVTVATEHRVPNGSAVRSSFINETIFVVMAT